MARHTYLRLIHHPGSLYKNCNTVEARHIPVLIPHEPSTYYLSHAHGMHVTCWVQMHEVSVQEWWQIVTWNSKVLIIHGVFHHIKPLGVVPPELFQLDSVCPFFVPVLYIYMFTSSDDNILCYLAIN